MPTRAFLACAANRGKICLVVNDDNEDAMNLLVYIIYEDEQDTIPDIQRHEAQGVIFDGKFGYKWVQH